ncbi:MAG TPA: hypothetical protein VLE93_02695 [Candidatus Saccharimonadales bacterium]|nr:hypothetical protein [Candidatus Saccharimonadales bacterium]
MYRTLSIAAIVSLITIFFCLLVVIGCEPEQNHQSSTPPASAMAVGKLVKIVPIQTSWNESQRSQVVTDKATYIVIGYPSGGLSTEVKLEKGPDALEPYYLWIEQPDGEFRRYTSSG